jgi:hypothetical protein
MAEILKKAKKAKKSHNAQGSLSSQPQRAAAARPEASKISRRRRKYKPWAFKRKRKRKREKKEKEEEENSPRKRRDIVYQLRTRKAEEQKRKMRKSGGCSK